MSDLFYTNNENMFTVTTYRQIEKVLMLSLTHWRDEQEAFKAQGITLPAHDIDAVRAAGIVQPVWIHVGGGNLYRAFHAEIAQDLMDKGLLNRGIVAVDTFSSFAIDHVYTPFHYDTLEVVMKANGTLCERVLSSTATALYAHPRNNPAGYHQLATYFASPDLQLVTFTITEKGYGLRDSSGDLLTSVVRELKAGPEHVDSTMGIVSALLVHRFETSHAPLALASTDNFSRNGERFREAVLTIVKGWQNNGFVSPEFVAWVSDEQCVSFPWSMIDRITPNPSPETEAALRQQGFEDVPLEQDGHGPVFAGFVNTEEANYLVIEDNFPNGRPLLEQAGVILTDRETAEKADTMKVTACLNPLHTCLAVFGCLLGYSRIWQEMEDKDLVSLIMHLGYDEDLPVVVDPQVINPRAFLDELIQRRLPNKSLPDTPQRIATDTSQKVAIRFGHTLQSYARDPQRNPAHLTYIPLTLAGWMRYLIGVDDAGVSYKVSPDPLLGELQTQLASIKLGEVSPDMVHAALNPVLHNQEIFGCDLYELGLGEKIEHMFCEQVAGPGAVRATITSYL